MTTIAAPRRNDIYVARTGEARRQAKVIRVDGMRIFYHRSDTTKLCDVSVIRFCEVYTLLERGEDYATERL